MIDDMLRATVCDSAYWPPTTPGAGNALPTSPTPLPPPFPARRSASPDWGSSARTPRRGRRPARSRQAHRARRRSRRYNPGQPTAVGPKKPPRLPMALIQAMPDAAAVPVSTIDGMVQTVGLQHVRSRHDRLPAYDGSRSTYPTPRRVWISRGSPCRFCGGGRNVGLDDPGVTAEVVVPHVVEDLRLGQHPLGLSMK